MTQQKFGWHSLRVKLVIGSIVVETIMLSLLLANSVRLTQDNLITATELRINEALPLLASSVTAPIMEEDLATLGEIVDRVEANKGFSYILITDSGGFTLVERGKRQSDVAAKPNVSLKKHHKDAGLTTPYLVDTAILLGTQIIGHLLLEVKTDFIAEALSIMNQQSASIAAIEVLLSIFLLAGLGFVITRQLYTLADAAEKMGNGDLSVRVPIVVHDEIGSTAAAFNRMAELIAEEQKHLQEKNEHIQLLMNSTEEAIYGIDVTGNCTFANRACLQILGYNDIDELRNRDMLNLCMSNNSTTESASLQLELNQNNFDKVHIKDGIIKHVSGNSIPVELRAHPAIKDDEIVGWVVTFLDISDRKHAEDIKNEFVSVISHELRTPLTSIKGALGIILGEAVGELPRAIRGLVKMALRNTEHQVNLVNDLLDFQKIEANKMDFRFEVYDLAEIIKQIVDDNMGYASEMNATFIVENNINKVFVKVDAFRLGQVVANLLSNAAKFSPPDSTVTIAMNYHKNNIRVSVSDKGEGIPEEFKAKMFQTFTQAENSATREKPGTGLGLAISKKIIEKMNGRIGFNSRPGQGTTMWFDLPVETSIANPTNAPITAVAQQ